jgi:hypothetical protein
VEPDVLVGGEGPGQLGTDDTDNVSQHREQDKASIVRKDQTGTSRGPDREPKSVKACQSRVGCLRAQDERWNFLGAVKYVHT